MGLKASNVQNLSTELDENYDPLQPEELLPSVENKSVENGDIPRTRKSPNRQSPAKNSTDGENISDAKEHGAPYEEEDEEEDQFAQKG